jgi:dCTP deaminase
MIQPFVNEKTITNGKSYGLSAASYDCRIKHDVTLGPNGSETCCALATTIERFAIPDNICGYVCDKSSYARVFVGAFNTLFDPGFSGKTVDNEDPEDPWADAVLELVNFGRYPIEIKAGDPICQFTFNWLDQPTNRPYRGKYSGQKGAQSAIHELSRQALESPVYASAPFSPGRG